ncbi:glycosyltransferase family 2 protein [Roseomonas sp. BN140053]|uniref:glycosyltransferase family 2 protein n=1 Tax=Roseomonas sp. BN140053 TaxID=3391898 RepID=UPI0039EC8EB9
MTTVAAVMMVRNEANIIADCAAHLLHGLAVDRLLVADNGSTDGTPAILRRIAAGDRRVQVTSVPGHFSQPEVMNALIGQAVAGGADWILPNDADEFLWLRGTSLRALCAGSPAVGGYRLPVRNFVQLRGVARDHPGSLETMLFSARPQGSEGEAQALVTTSAIPFLRMHYPPKLLLRATAGLRLHRGQHRADGALGPLLPLRQGEMLHAPIRARDDLASRVEHGRRLRAVAPEPGTGWHLKRLLHLDETGLQAEWDGNSVGFDRWRPAPGFQLDLRLCRLAWRLRPHRRRALGGGGTGPRWVGQGRFARRATGG